MLDPQPAAPERQLVLLLERPIGELLRQRGGELPQLRGGQVRALLGEEAVEVELQLLVDGDAAKRLEDRAHLRAVQLARAERRPRPRQQPGQRARLAEAARDLVAAHGQLERQAEHRRPLGELDGPRAGHSGRHLDLGVRDRVVDDLCDAVQHLGLRPRLGAQRLTRAVEPRLAEGFRGGCDRAVRLAHGHSETRATDISARSPASSPQAQPRAAIEKVMGTSSRPSASTQLSPSGTMAGRYCQGSVSCSRKASSASPASSRAPTTSEIGCRHS
jgi:hypothetical protein